MKSFYRPILGGLLALALMLVAHGAAAIPFAEVKFNGFSLLAFSGTADGVIIGGPGNPIAGIAISVASKTTTLTKIESGGGQVNFAKPSATAAGGTGSAAISGIAQAFPNGYAFGNLVFEVTFAFKNLTGIDLDTLTIRTDFSSFNPGGPQVGASVDNSFFEFARYESSQSGRGIGDSHHCDTRINSGSGNPTFPTPPPSVACGVSSPDSSQGEFAFLDIDQNETVTETFRLILQLEVENVPEPGTLTLFGAALVGFAGFGALRRRS